MLSINKPKFPATTAFGLAQLCDQMVLAQNALNSTIRPDWPAAQFPFLRAARAEISEAQGYTSWEWWKNLAANEVDVFRTTSDRDEFHMELVDALHFMLSALIQEKWNGEGWRYHDLPSAGQQLYGLLVKGRERHLEGYARATHGEDANAPLGPDSTLRRVEQLQFRLYEEKIGEAFCELVEVAEHTGLGLIGLVGRYFAKGVLNQFRQQHGYKEKTYIKNWGDGKEDNYYLNRETIPLLSSYSLEELVQFMQTGSFQQTLHSRLTDMYLRVERTGHCDHDAACAAQ